MEEMTFEEAMAYVTDLVRMAMKEGNIPLALIAIRKDKPQTPIPSLWSDPEAQQLALELIVHMTDCLKDGRVFNRAEDVN
jgi:hypothetical protein